VKFTNNVALVEDAIQEVLMTIWSGREKIKDIANPDAYFLSSFRNALFKKIKAVALQVPIGQGEWEPDFSAEAIILKRETDNELQQQFKKALNTLTPRQREAIFLRFYEGLSYEEVAETLGITVKATYKIMARALTQLKDNLSLPLIYMLLFLRGVA